MKKGFTLIELICVIIILGLILSIAIPNALRISKSVDEKAYKTKISLIEAAAKNYGNDAISNIRTGSELDGNNYVCTITTDTNKNITKIERKTVNYVPNMELNSNEYFCVVRNVEDLVESSYYNYDETNKCDDSLCNVDYYNNIVVNPIDKHIINLCNVYIYYKNNRIYTYFDKTTCDIKTENPSVGHEYEPFSNRKTTIISN